uniref:Uncharacterized protein n=1 Tax=Rhizophora mucronata TaxID=61149 RepID=A0A2P2QUL2_RHIMU
MVSDIVFFRWLRMGLKLRTFGFRDDSNSIKLRLVGGSLTLSCLAFQQFFKNFCLLHWLNVRLL